MQPNEYMIAIMGYAVVTTYLLEHDMDINDDEDVKDALVIIAMEEEHFSDEDLNEGLAEFRFLQRSINRGS